MGRWVVGGSSEFFCRLRASWALGGACLLVLAGSFPVFAETEFTNQIPNGTLNDSNSRGSGCGHCHVAPSSAQLNAFGSRWKEIGWGAQLASEDTDGDDVLNGWELGDPLGSWQSGNPAPGSAALVTSPGQAGSVPPLVSVTPLEIDHAEAQGENLSQSFSVENVGGDCFGNPMGACTLDFEVSSAELWMEFDPSLGMLGPQESALIDVLFTTDGLLGVLEGSATVAAADVQDSPQDVLVTVTVPEPDPLLLETSALLVLPGLVFCSRRRSTTG